MGLKSIKSIHSLIFFQENYISLILDSFDLCLKGKAVQWKHLITRQSANQ